MVTGPLLMEQANIYIMEMDLEIFSGSHTWLHSFMLWHCISLSILSGEVVVFPKPSLLNISNNFQPDISARYELKDIFNVDTVASFTGRSRPCPLYIIMIPAKVVRTRRTNSTSPSSSAVPPWERMEDDHHWQISAALFIQREGCSVFCLLPLQSEVMNLFLNLMSQKRWECLSISHALSLSSSKATTSAILSL